MPNITFSFLYEKLKRGMGGFYDEATLISVCKVNIDVLPKEFIWFDTLYYENEVEKHYPLNEQWYLILTFFPFFTTIRPYKVAKEEYYRSLIGKKFNIVIKE